MSPDCLPSPCRRRYTRAGECVFHPSKGRSVATVEAYGEKTYTFSSQDVYVLFGIGIRLVWESYTSHFSTLKGRPFERIIRSSPENTLSTCRLHRQAKERIPKMRYTTSLQSKKECYNKRSKNIFSSTTLIDLSTAITTFASVILKLMQYDEIYPPYVSPTTRTIFLR